MPHDTDDASAHDTGAHDRGAEDTSADFRDEHDGLLSRLELIEERPLQERADAYTRIHGELAEALEGGTPRLEDD